MKTQVAYKQRTHSSYTHILVASLAFGLTALLVTDMVRNFHYSKNTSVVNFSETNYALPVVHVNLAEIEVFGIAPESMASEQDRTIEQWMINPAEFATEPVIELKEWMYGFELPVKEEAPAQIHSWMLEVNDWCESQFSEEPVQIQNWMYAFNV